MRIQAAACCRLNGRLDLEIPMATSSRRQRMFLRTGQYLAWLTATAIACLACGSLSLAQGTSQVHRTLTVTMSEPLTLEVDVSRGDVEILYGRDGQMSISGVARASANSSLDDNFFSSVLSVEQVGNRVTVRHVPNLAHGEEGVKVVYRIDVPYRTQLTSRVNQGKQTISGIMGPVKATTGNGDIKASYISKGLQA